MKGAESNLGEFAWNLGMAFPIGGRHARFHIDGKDFGQAGGQ